MAIIEVGFHSGTLDGGEDQQIVLATKIDLSAFLADQFVGHPDFDDAEVLAQLEGVDQVGHGKLLRPALSGFLLRVNNLVDSDRLQYALVESGLRFVQLYDYGWDDHGANRDSTVDVGLPARCRGIDRPMADLMKDLKQRGLLEDTLVVWGGEFGRTPMRENRGGVEMPFLGHDHHGEAFTIWLAGSGVRPGVVYR